MNFLVRKPDKFIRKTERDNALIRLTNNAILIYIKTLAGETLAI